MKSATMMVYQCGTQCRRLSSANIRTLRQKKTLPKRQQIKTGRAVTPLQISCRVSKNPLLNNFFGQKNSKKKLPRKVFRKDLRQKQESFLLQNSDRMKLIYWSQQRQLTQNLLVLSIDFIINQDNFWKQQVISPNIIKQWKHLHSIHTIFWITRRKYTLEKLKMFCSLYQLPLDAVFYIQRKGNYTVDYNPILSNFTDSVLNGINKICILDTIKINDKDTCTYQTYRGKIPIIFHQGIKIGLVRIEGDPPGLSLAGSLLKKLSFYSQQQNRTPSTSIPYYIYHSLALAKDKAKQKLNKTAYTQQQQLESDRLSTVEEKLDSFRRNLIQEIIKNQGRSYKFQGSSIHYFVGDIIKRNHNVLMKQIKNQQQKINKTKQQSVSKKKDDQLTRQGNQKIDKIEPLNLKIISQYYQFYK